MDINSILLLTMIIVLPTLIIMILYYAYYDIWATPTKSNRDKRINASRRLPLVWSITGICALSVILYLFGEEIWKSTFPSLVGLLIFFIIVFTCLLVYTLWNNKCGFDPKKTK